jgi:rubrerythrin
VQPCKHATLKFSKADSSALGLVMDALDRELATVISKTHKYPEAIRAAAKLGKDTINRYYEATDQSKLYHIATSKWFKFQRLPFLIC